MDLYEQTRIKRRNANILSKIKTGSKFTTKELETLLLMHHQASAAATNGIDRRTFRAIIHNSLDMTDDAIMNRIFVTFDGDSDNAISATEFIHGMSIFLRGSTKDQVNYCFSVYDVVADGKITRENMFQLLRKCVVRAPSEEDAEEGVKDLVEVLFRVCDEDKDGRVSLEDFRKAVEKEPLLIQSLGPCLPGQQARDAFLTALAEKPPTY